MSRVVVVKLYSGRDKGQFTRDEYRLLLSVGLQTLSGEKDLSAAVRKYIPSGIVGLKPNCLAGKANSTPVKLADAFCELLVSTGFDENDLVIWERTSRELSDAGYRLNAASFGRRCLGTDANGVGYSKKVYVSDDVNSLITRILTEMVDVNVNLPLLKDHSVAGLSGGLKNMYGAINNPNKYHDNNCDPHCAHVSNLEPIRSKNRLTILDAVKVQYHGGPGYVAGFISHYGGVVISDDPVAVDSVGLEILEHIRKENNQPDLGTAGRPVKYLQSAEQLGLGLADVKRIDLKVVTVDDHGNQHPGELF